MIRRNVSRPKTPFRNESRSKTPFKKTEVNLNYLINKLDIWHHKAISWLDNNKTNPSKDEIEAFGIEIIHELYIRKVLTKEGINGIKFPEPPLTPKRIRSASPNRQISPGSGRAGGRLIARVSRRDQHENADIKTKLDFEDEHNAYVPKNQSSLVSEKYYIENINNLKEEIISLRRSYEEIEKENEFLKQSINQIEELSVRNYQEIHRELVLENVVLKEKLGTQERCSYKVQADQYQKERNLARYENHKLKEELEKLKSMKSKGSDESKIVLLNYEKEKQRKMYQELLLDTNILKETLQEYKKKIASSEANVDFMEKEKIALTNTIENLKLQILEIQNRGDDKFRDANIAITRYTDEANRYKTASEEAKAKIIPLTMEKEELQSLLQKQKKICMDEKQNFDKEKKNLQKKIKELEKEKKQCVENTETLIKRITECEKQQKELAELQREHDDIKREGKSNLKLINENNSLHSEVFEMKNKHAAEIREHIDVVRQYKNKIVHYKEEKDSANKKVDKLKHDLKDASDRFKEQEAISNRQMAVHEAKIRDLQKQLSETESSRWENARYMTDDYQKEELVNKNGEIATLTRKIYSMEEELGLCSETKRLLEVKNEDLKKKLKEAVEQHFSLEERLSSSNFKRLSDIEKENVSLKEELSVTLDCLNKERQEFKDQEKRLKQDDRKMTDIIKQLKSEKDILEIDNSTLEGQIEKLQEQWNHFKSQETMKQDFSRKETSSLNDQKFQLEQDKQLLRNKIFTLETQNEKLNERMKNTESDTIKVQQYKTENESLRKRYAQLKSDFTTLEAKLEAESTIRLNKDQTLENLKEENNRLRKERNTSQTEMQTATREKKKISEALQTEKHSGKAELDKLKTEKAELIAVFKEKSNNDKEKIDRLERENKNLHSTCSRFTSDEKANQNNAYEFMQLKNDHEICKKQKLQLEEDLLDVKQDYDELERKLKETEKHNNKISEENKEELKRLETQIQILEFKESTLKRESLQCKNCEEYKQKLASSRQEYEALHDRYNNAIATAHAAERNVQELRKQVEKERKNIKEICEEMKSLENEKNKMEIELRLNKSSLETESGDIMNLRTENAELKHNIMNSKEEKNGIQRENKKLKEDVQNLSIQVEKLESRLNISKDETSYVQQKNAELEKSLQEKVKQLKSSEARFRDLAGSIQNSEGLQNRIYTLELEVSELNKRLSVLEDENLSLQKGNKDLKNKIEEKSQQLKTAEERLREYAVELEGIPSLKRRLENLQTDNAELEKRCRQKDGLLQKADSNAQKMKKDNQQLQTQMISQKQNYDTLNNKLESLKDKNIELEDRLRRRSPVVVAEPKNCQNCFKYRNDISDLKREINDLRDRLSEAAGNKLRDNNPNIADLSDMNRPTSLAEKFSSLYTDEYTDAMEVIEDDMDEAASVRVMLDWLKRCYEWCQRLAKEQRDTLINKSIGFMENHGGQNVVLSDRCLIFVKEFQKKIAVESLAVVGQICHVKSVTQQTLSTTNYIVKYIKKCSELCWMMQISDPPLYLNFDVNSGENLNKNDYNVFTKSGSKIDYLVWPVLYLHKTGPMLAKGVAQGK